MIRSHSIPAGTGPDSLWRQAERSVEEENAGTPPFAERVAAAITSDLHTVSYPWRLMHPPARAALERRMAAIIDRHIREATGVR